MVQYEIDICDTTSMMYTFCNMYNLEEHDDYQEIFRIFFDKYYCVDGDNNKKNMSKSCDVKDLQIGDYIRVQYIPYSQTYVDFYKEIEGTVIYIDNRKKNGLIYIDIDNVRHIYSIEKDYLSYYGETEGYCCFITK